MTPLEFFVYGTIAVFAWWLWAETRLLSVGQHPNPERVGRDHGHAHGRALDDLGHGVHHRRFDDGVEDGEADSGHRNPDEQHEPESPRVNHGPSIAPSPCPGRWPGAGFSCDLRAGHDGDHAYSDYPRYARWSA